MRFGILKIEKKRETNSSSSTIKVFYCVNIFCSLNNFVHSCKIILLEMGLRLFLLNQVMKQKKPPMLSS